MAKEKILINAYVEGFNCKYADVTTELSKYGIEVIYKMNTYKIKSDFNVHK